MVRVVPPLDLSMLSLCPCHAVAAEHITIMLLSLTSQTYVPSILPYMYNTI